jgi:hypothetical protein
MPEAWRLRNDPGSAAPAFLAAVAGTSWLERKFTYGLFQRVLNPY